MTERLEMLEEEEDMACCCPDDPPELELFDPSMFRTGNWLRSIPFRLIVSELVIPSKLIPLRLTMSALARLTGILTVACWSFATG